MITTMSNDKRDLLRRLQEAVGRSPIRLRILKEINKKESMKELMQRLKIKQSTMSTTISRLLAHGLIVFIENKAKSKVYDKVPLLKQIGSIDKWVTTEIDEDTEQMETHTVKVNQKHCVDVPFLDYQAENDAKKMAEGPYYIIYLFENSIRNFINKVLTKQYGADWWSRITKSDLVNKVESRKEIEKQNKWHGVRGGHEIFYTDIDDLPYFLKKEEELFKKHLSDVDLWITRIKKETALSRNIVDHHNPLPKREIDRLSQTFEDWKKQLKGVMI